jgi:hypothetical protein
MHLPGLAHHRIARLAGDAAADELDARSKHAATMEIEIAGGDEKIGISGKISAAANLRKRADGAFCVHFEPRSRLKTGAKAFKPHHLTEICNGP